MIAIRTNFERRITCLTEDVTQPTYFAAYQYRPYVLDTELSNTSCDLSPGENEADNEADDEEIKFDKGVAFC